MGTGQTTVLADAKLSRTVRPPHLLADLYIFNWKEMELRLPAVSAAAVSFCLGMGIGLGHPGGALVAAGGAFTVGFGANQRISDSRVWPMVLATILLGVATLTGTLVGHRGYALIVASAATAAIYGVLTIRNAGLAWVGQQAAVALFVASAFPSGPKHSFERAGLIVAGGLVQTFMTTAGLHLIPELQTDLLAIPRVVYASVYEQRKEFFRRLQELPKALPAPDRAAAALYAGRLVITVAMASGLYRYLGLQSGYWIPMTAMLVQKPAFFETLTRAMLRVGGTLAGAVLATLLVQHVPMGPWWLALGVTLCAFGAFVAMPVNYGIFSLFLTSYIVFLLSLNEMPGPEIAHRRAGCTALGALIALLIHFDALRRHRAAAPMQGMTKSVQIL
jgi:hypothetical protein